MTPAEAAAKLEAIRAELPVTRCGAFLNTGSNGPLPRRGHQVMVAEAERELAAGRWLGSDAVERYHSQHGRVRDSFAALLGCEASELALTHSTTEGINIALHGLDWRRGDRLVTAVTEHPGVTNPVALLSQRRGVRVIATDIGLPGVDPLAALEAVLDPAPKAVVLSHVSFASGIVQPIKELTQAAHRAGAMVIIDGAQSVGMIPVDVHDLGVDAYAGPGQKWLCGPSGTGVLYVRADRLDDVGVTVAGYSAGTASRDVTSLVAGAGTARFEAITLHGPSLDALGTTMQWLAGGDVGWSWAFERIAALGRRAHAALGAVPGVQMVAFPATIAGLVSFVVDAILPDQVTAQLRDLGFFIRNVTEPVANRVSTGFYNTEDEIDALAEAVASLRPSP